MSGAANAFRIAGSVVLLLVLVAAGQAAPIARPLPDACGGKSDRLALPELVSAGGPSEQFVTIARRHGPATTVLEKVAVAH